MRSRWEGQLTQEAEHVKYKLHVEIQLFVGCSFVGIQENWLNLHGNLFRLLSRSPSQMNSLSPITIARHRKPHIPLHISRVVVRVVERFLHTEQPVSLSVVAQVLQLRAAVLQRPLDTVRAPGHAPRPQPGHDEGERPASVRTRHGGAVHELSAAQSELRHGGDGAPGGAHAHASVSVYGRAAGSPSVRSPW